MNQNHKRLVAAAAAVACAGAVTLYLRQSPSPQSHLAVTTAPGPAVTTSADPPPPTTSTPTATPGPPTVLRAIMARDISLCNHRPPTPPARIELCHDEYHFFLSLKEGVDHCDDIKQKMLRDACRMLMTGDNRCSELVPERTIDGMHEPDNIRSVCESCFGNLKACDSLKDDHDRGLCTSMHYLVKATQARDPSICERIVNEEDNKFLCLYLAEK